MVEPTFVKRQGIGSNPIRKVGQKVSALSFRSNILGLWKIKSYPSDLKSILLRKNNIYMIIQSFLWSLNIEIIFYKTYFYKEIINIYIYILRYKFKYKILRVRRRKLSKKLRKIRKKNKIILYKKNSSILKTKMYIKKINLNYVRYIKKNI